MDDNIFERLEKLVSAYMAGLYDEEGGITQCSVTGPQILRNETLFFVHQSLVALPQFHNYNNQSKYLYLADVPK